MSEYDFLPGSMETDYSTGGSAAGAVFGGTQSAGGDYYEPAYEPGYDSGDDEDYEFELDELADLGFVDPAQLTQYLAQQAVEAGEEPLLALAQGREAAEAYFTERAARAEWAAHVEAQEQQAEGRERMAELIDVYAQEHGVPPNARGAIPEISGGLYDRAVQAAIDAGDEETLEWLSSPEGAAEQVELAAQVAKARSFSQNARSRDGGRNGVFDPGSNPGHASHAARMAEAFRAEMPWNTYITDYMNRGKK